MIYFLEASISPVLVSLSILAHLSLVLVNVYMEYFKEMALRSTSMWLRYVDGIFLLWPHKEDVQALMDHVNSIQPSIQFTMEKSKAINFLS